MERPPARIALFAQSNNGKPEPWAVRQASFALKQATRDTYTPRTNEKDVEEKKGIPRGVGIPKGVMGSLSFFFLSVC